jgi:hypothetical protein
MALTINNRHYTNTTSTISTYPNYSSHCTSDLLVYINVILYFILISICFQLPLPSKSSPVNMSLKNQPWHDFMPETSLKIIKDETFDPLHPANHHSTGNKSSSGKSNTENPVQKKKPVIAKRKFDVFYFILIV